ncbi:MAG: response regulator, partial [Deltaproteobacteria bacterium]|nr:response regulator [Deltaproteobacteria bacterium]
MGKKLGKALVVGAGISGIRTALDLAETGYGVTLVDREPHLGGVLSQLDDQFPSNHCGMCKMLPLVKRDQSSQFCLRKGLFHENIDILLNTDVIAIDGEPGKFSVSVRKKPTWVDPQRCVGCGVCEAVCPVEIPDTFNEALTTRKAIYLPVPHTIPNPYVIDLAACSHCGECEKICPTQAIELSLEKRKDFRVLVVDDELIVRDSLKEWLTEEGFFVDAAESGPAALEKLSNTPFNLMLTDIKMPGMDGVELLRKAKESFPDLCVLMMTAFATVETAVEAMKIGAQDYLMKPFDPEQMIAKTVQIYEEIEGGDIRDLEVGAIVFSGGTSYFDPADSKDIYAYKTNPNVITSLELERLLSGTGPTQGRLIRPHDGKNIKKIAWIQCVGSRDIQHDADYCSSVCCMVAIKEATLVAKKSPSPVETAIFYMDMRTFGKSFQRYRDNAEQEHGVRFE